MTRFVGTQLRPRRSRPAARCKDGTVQDEAGNALRYSQKEISLRDLLFTLATVLFFVLSAGYVRACERLK